MKPHGEEGIETIKNMNENHQGISEFAFHCIKVCENDKIIDIGCGGGVNIEKFLKLTKNNVDGLDYSEISVSESEKRNKNEITIEDVRLSKQMLAICHLKTMNMTLQVLLKQFIFGQILKTHLKKF